MIDWRRVLGRAGMTVDGDDVHVAFENGRGHKVKIRETEPTIEVRAIVARAAALKQVEDLHQRLWRRNRSAQLVGFKVDARGTVVASGWVPRAGMTAEELVLVVRRVAEEADRLEFLLTGADRE